MRPTTKVSSRLPNSITPCTPISGVVTYDSSVHRGQVGQPRPEAVSRTAPPVTTMPTLAMIEASARRRSSEAGDREPDGSASRRKSYAP